MQANLNPTKTKIGGTSPPLNWNFEVVPGSPKNTYGEKKQKKEPRKGFVTGPGPFPSLKVYQTCLATK